jgi:hypothetical protein
MSHMTAPCRERAGRVCPVSCPAAGPHKGDGIGQSGRLDDPHGSYIP